MRQPESFVGQPIRSLQTMLQVIARNDESYADLIPDGIYGPETMQAVAVFQRKHLLPVTGITDLATWEAIVPVFDMSLANQDTAAPIEVVWNPGIVILCGKSHPNLFLAQGMLAVLSDVLLATKIFLNLSFISNVPSPFDVITFSSFSFSYNMLLMC